MLRCISLALTLLLLLAAPAAADIEIRAPGQQTIPLAITTFLPLDQGVKPSVAAEFNEVLNSDLDLSGLFRMVDPAAFLSDARHLGLISIDVDFAQWRMLGAEDLIKGGYSVRGGQLVVEARLYDVTGSRLLNGRRYVGKVKDVRRMAHAFADQVLKSSDRPGGSLQYPDRLHRQPDRAQGALPDGGGRP